MQDWRRQIWWQRSWDFSGDGECGLMQPDVAVSIEIIVCEETESDMTRMRAIALESRENAVSYTSSLAQHNWFVALDRIASPSGSSSAVDLLLLHWIALSELI